MHLDRFLTGCGVVCFIVGLALGGDLSGPLLAVAILALLAILWRQRGSGPSSPGGGGDAIGGPFNPGHNETHHHGGFDGGSHGGGGHGGH